MSKVSKPVIRGRFDTPDRVVVATSVKDRCATRAKQSFRDECDIHSILKRHAVTGYVKGNPKAPAYFDVPEGLDDFQSSLNRVIAAQEGFMALDPKIRDRFKNDPAAFLAFMSDPANLDEMVTLGLRPKPKDEPKPDKGPDRTPDPKPAPAGSEAD